MRDNDQKVPNWTIDKVGESHQRLPGPTTIKGEGHQRLLRGTREDQVDNQRLSGRTTIRIEVGDYDQRMLVGTIKMEIAGDGDHQRIGEREVTPNMITRGFVDDDHDVPVGDGRRVIHCMVYKRNMWKF